MVQISPRGVKHEFVPESLAEWFGLGRVGLGPRRQGLIGGHDVNALALSSSQVMQGLARLIDQLSVDERA